jgi:hypothetical protein
MGSQYTEYLNYQTALNYTLHNTTTTLTNLEHSLLLSDPPSSLEPSNIPAPCRHACQRPVTSLPSGARASPRAHTTRASYRHLASRDLALHYSVMAAQDKAPLLFIKLISQDNAMTR